MNKRVPVVKQMWIKQILDFKKIKHFTVALLRDANTQCTPLMSGGGGTWLWQPAPKVSPVVLASCYNGEVRPWGKDLLH